MDFTQTVMIVNSVLLTPQCAFVYTALHHMFPTVDESRHPTIKPILEDVCRQFNLVYQNHRYIDVFRESFTTWFRQDKNVSRYPLQYGGPSKMKDGDVKKTKAQ